MSLELLLDDIIKCTICEDLPLGPRPVMQAGTGASVIIIGQAPGRKVHESGVPWDDPSGKRLRGWLGVDSDTFYDPTRIALVPMGFCYPGTGSGGDLPPRPECAPAWHDKLWPHLDDSALRVILGNYAIDRYVPERARTLTDTVKAFRELLPDRVVLPHPSPRNQRWLRNNPWFEDEVLPVLRERVSAALAS